LQQMKADGIRTIRIMSLFADLRSGIRQDAQGNFLLDAQGQLQWDSKAMDDLVAFFEELESAGIKVVPALLDFRLVDGIATESTPGESWAVGEHPELFTDPAMQEKAVALFGDLFHRLYDPNDAQFGRFNLRQLIPLWQVMNEPESATGVSFPQVQSFINRFIDTIHAQASGAKVSVASTSRDNAFRLWADRMDVVSVNYYSKFDSEPLDENAGHFGFGDKPVFMTEMGGGGTHTLSSTLLTLQRNGYAGGLFWSDSEYPFDQAAYKQWVQANQPMWSTYLPLITSSEVQGAGYKVQGGENQVVSLQQPEDVFTAFDKAEHREVNLHVLEISFPSLDPAQLSNLDTTSPVSHWTFEDAARFRDSLKVLERQALLQVAKTPKESWVITYPKDQLKLVEALLWPQVNVEDLPRFDRGDGWGSEEEWQQMQQQLTELSAIPQWRQEKFPPEALGMEAIRINKGITEASDRSWSPEGLTAGNTALVFRSDGSLDIGKLSLADDMDNTTQNTFTFVQWGTSSWLDGEWELIEGLVSEENQGQVYGFAGRPFENKYIPIGKSTGDLSTWSPATGIQITAAHARNFYHELGHAHNWHYGPPYYSDDSKWPQTEAFGEFFAYRTVADEVDLKAYIPVERLNVSGVAHPTTDEDSSSRALTYALAGEGLWRAVTEGHLPLDEALQRLYENWRQGQYPEVLGFLENFADEDFDFGRFHIFDSENTHPEQTVIAPIVVEAMEDAGKAAYAFIPQYRADSDTGFDAVLENWVYALDDGRFLASGLRMVHDNQRFIGEHQVPPDYSGPIQVNWKLSDAGTGEVLEEVSYLYYWKGDTSVDTNGVFAVVDEGMPTAPDAYEAYLVDKDSQHVIELPRLRTEEGTIVLAFTDPVSQQRRFVATHKLLYQRGVVMNVSADEMMTLGQLIVKYPHVSQATQWTPPTDVITVYPGENLQEKLDAEGVYGKKFQIFGTLRGEPLDIPPGVTIEGVGDATYIVESQSPTGGQIAGVTMSSGATLRNLTLNAMSVKRGVALPSDVYDAEVDRVRIFTPGPAIVVEGGDYNNIVNNELHSPYPFVRVTSDARDDQSLYNFLSNNPHYPIPQIFLPLTSLPRISQEAETEEPKEETEVLSGTIGLLGTSQPPVGMATSPIPALLGWAMSHPAAIWEAGQQVWQLMNQGPQTGVTPVAPIATPTATPFQLEGMPEALLAAFESGVYHVEGRTITLSFPALDDAKFAGLNADTLITEDIWGPQDAATLRRILDAKIYNAERSTPGEDREWPVGEPQLIYSENWQGELIEKLLYPPLGAEDLPIFQRPATTPFVSLWEWMVDGLDYLSQFIPQAPESEETPVRRGPGHQKIVSPTAQLGQPAGDLQAEDVLVAFKDAQYSVDGRTLELSLPILDQLPNLNPAELQLMSPQEVADLKTSVLEELQWTPKEAVELRQILDDAIDQAFKDRSGEAWTTYRNESQQKWIEALLYPPMSIADVPAFDRGDGWSDTEWQQMEAKLAELAQTQEWRSSIPVEAASKRVKVSKFEGASGSPNELAVNNVLPIWEGVDGDDPVLELTKLSLPADADNTTNNTFSIVRWSGLTDDKWRGIKAAVLSEEWMTRFILHRGRPYTRLPIYIRFGDPAGWFGVGMLQINDDSAGTLAHEFSHAHNWEMHFDRWIAEGLAEANRAFMVETDYANDYVAYEQFNERGIRPQSAEDDILAYKEAEFGLLESLGYIFEDPKWVDGVATYLSRLHDGRPGALPALYALWRVGLRPNPLNLFEVYRHEDSGEIFEFNDPPENPPYHIFGLPGVPFTGVIARPYAYLRDIESFNFALQSGEDSDPQIPDLKLKYTLHRLDGSKISEEVAGLFDYGARGSSFVVGPVPGEAYRATIEVWDIESNTLLGTDEYLSYAGPEDSTFDPQATTVVVESGIPSQLDVYFVRGADGQLLWHGDNYRESHSIPSGNVFQLPYFLGQDGYVVIRYEDPDLGPRFTVAKYLLNSRGLSINVVADDAVPESELSFQIADAIDTLDEVTTWTVQRGQDVQAVLNLASFGDTVEFEELPEGEVWSGSPFDLPPGVHLKGKGTGRTIYRVEGQSPITVGSAATLSDMTLVSFGDVAVKFPGTLKATAENLAIVEGRLQLYGADHNTIRNVGFSVSEPRVLYTTDPRGDDSSGNSVTNISGLPSPPGMSPRVYIPMATNAGIAVGAATSSKVSSLQPVEITVLAAGQAIPDELPPMTEIPGEVSVTAIEADNTDLTLKPMPGAFTPNKPALHVNVHQKSTTGSGVKLAFDRGTLTGNLF
ncbi:MAG: hypothetical protein HYT88_04570, partial [Candidatus Omnitrophica bacterium]|nr:hypothetical protein [Candidatus Omnitrophota bacterium]